MRGKVKKCKITSKYRSMLYKVAHEILLVADIYDVL